MTEEEQYNLYDTKVFIFPLALHFLVLLLFLSLALSLFPCLLLLTQLSIPFFPLSLSPSITFSLSLKCSLHASQITAPPTHTRPNYVTLCCPHSLLSFFLAFPLPNLFFHSPSLPLLLSIHLTFFLLSFSPSHFFHGFYYRVLFIPFLPSCSSLSLSLCFILSCLNKCPIL